MSHNDEKHSYKMLNHNFKICLSIYFGFIFCVPAGNWTLHPAGIMVSTLKKSQAHHRATQEQTKNSHILRHTHLELQINLIWMDCFLGVGYSEYLEKAMHALGENANSTQKVPMQLHATPNFELLAYIIIMACACMILGSFVSFSGCIGLYCFFHVLCSVLLLFCLPDIVPLFIILCILFSFRHVQQSLFYETWALWPLGPRACILSSASKNCSFSHFVTCVTDNVPSYCLRTNIFVSYLVFQNTCDLCLKGVTNLLSWKLKCLGHMLGILFE